MVVAGVSGGSVLVQRLSSAGQPNGQYLGPAGVARAVAIQSDGKLVVAGSKGGAMLVVRLNSNLTLDPTFGAGGIASVYGGSAIANGVAIGPDGKIVVAGSVPFMDSNGGTSTRPGLARFNANGTLDTSFGSGGTQVIDHGHPDAVANGVVVQPDGKIVFAGNWNDPTYPVANGVLERLTPGGADDPTFAGGFGVYQYFSPDGGASFLNAVTLQNDGMIVAAGAKVAGSDALFVRLASNGTPDGGFGAQGVATQSSGSSSFSPIGAYGVGIGGGGAVVGAGAVAFSGSLDYRAGLWALTAAGAPQPSFASNNPANAQPDNAESCALAIEPSTGNLIAAGDTVSPTTSQNPCTVDSGSDFTPNGLVERYIGLGPPPPPTPSGAAPSARTGAANAVTEVSATLAGQVNPNGLATSYHFDYGNTRSYGTSTPSADAGSGTTSTAVSATLTGLTPGSTWHYRLVATNAKGTTRGGDQSFTTTPATLPSSQTGAAKAVTEVSATLAGQLNPDGLPTSYHFDYGRTAAYGSSTPTRQLAAGGSPVAVSARLGALRPGSTYHYRLVATNADGTSYGRDMQFTTAPRLRASVKGVLSSYRIATILRSGVPVSVGCSQPCSIRGSLVISGALAKRLGLGTKPYTIAGASASRKRPGTAVMRLRLTGKAKQALVGKQLTATLRIASRPSHGGPVINFSRTVTLNP